MFRVLRFVAVVAVLVAAAVWLADRPGTATLQWQGYRIDTSFTVLAVAVAAIAAVAAAVYRFWSFLRRAPAALGESWRAKRKQKGYRALTRGMVAVAAGDADEARRQVKRADVLLNEPPLTMLLSAQAAQLAGDDTAAEKFFAAMADNPETEFLGIRGLLTQAVKRRDTDKALDLARRAYRLRPKSEWVTNALFDMQVRKEQWLDARATLDDSQRRLKLDSETARRRRAVLTLGLALEADEQGDGETAARHARDALDMASDLVPAAVLLAKTLTAAGKGRKAAAAIERTWREAPHPALLDAYLAATAPDDALERVRAAQRLTKNNLKHVESHIALAGVALDARLWGEARRSLGAVGDDPPARVCRAMAALEELEHGNVQLAREWLVRATLADPDPAWVCDTCGNTVKDWRPACGKCDTFDGYRWRTPPHVAALSAPVPPPGLAAPNAAPALVPPAGNDPDAKPA